MQRLNDLYVAIKVKKCKVREIRFSVDDPCEAVAIILHNDIALYRSEHYMIGHSVQEVRKRFEQMGRSNGD